MKHFYLLLLLTASLAIIQLPMLQYRLCVRLRNNSEDPLTYNEWNGLWGGQGEIALVMVMAWAANLLSAT